MSENEKWKKLQATVKRVMLQLVKRFWVKSILIVFQDKQNFFSLSLWYVNVLSSSHISRVDFFSAHFRRWIFFQKLKSSKPKRVEVKRGTVNVSRRMGFGTRRRKESEKLARSFEHEKCWLVKNFDYFDFLFSLIFSILYFLLALLCVPMYKCLFCLQRTKNRTKNSKSCE